MHICLRLHKFLVLKLDLPCIPSVIVCVNLGFINDLISVNHAPLQVAIDSAAPLDEAGPSGNTMLNSMDSFRGYGGPVRPYFDESPVRPYGRMYDSLDFDDVSIDCIFIIIICIAESMCEIDNKLKKTGERFERILNLYFLKSEDLTYKLIIYSTVFINQVDSHSQLLDSVTDRI